MANDHDGADSTAAGSTVEKYGDNPPSAGTAVVVADEIPNPGFPPYRPRVADIDPKKERQQERRVSGLFVVSIIGTVFASTLALPVVPLPVTPTGCSIQVVARFDVTVIVPGVSNALMTVNNAVPVPTPFPVIST